MALKGFLARGDASGRGRIPLAPECGACGLHLQCRSPKMLPYGRGRRKVLVLGEAPGEVEDSRGRPFVGKSGQLLREAVFRAGFDLDDDCWVTNAIVCHPKGNATPTDKQVGHCRPNLIAALKKFNPESVLVLGGTAVKSLIGMLWKDDAGGDKKQSGVSRWAGWRIPSQKLNAWVVPTFHPSFILRQTEDLKKTPNGALAEALFFKHVKRALTFNGRPWNPVPDYHARAEVVTDDDEAAARVKKYTGGTVVFDFETTTLKPHGPHAEVVCCSVCWEGEECFAFPWRGRAARAMCRLMENPEVGKASQNLQFEHSWARDRLGVTVRGWLSLGDTMLNAHALDCRSGVTGLKFQAFARLGFGDYSSHVEPYLRAKGGNAPNRIRQLDPMAVLKYCSLDSLLEYELLKLQLKDIGRASRGHGR